MRLKIGEFSRLGQVSVQTLRYYADLGLLIPCEVDRFSGYRYYSLDQLPRLHQILALKDLGMSLEQVGHLLRENLSQVELRRILQVKQAELREQVQADLDRLDRIQTRLRLLEQQNEAPRAEVILKQIPTIRVVSHRECVPSYWEVTPLWNTLLARIAPFHLDLNQPPFTLCHAVEPQIDLEVCFPVPADCPEELETSTLPAIETMACALHQGPFTGLASGFAALLGWADANGYQTAGPDREIYLRLPKPGQSETDPEAITELQVPVVKMT